MRDKLLALLKRYVSEIETQDFDAIWLCADEISDKVAALRHTYYPTEMGGPMHPYERKPDPILDSLNQPGGANAMSTKRQAARPEDLAANIALCYLAQRHEPECAEGWQRLIDAARARLVGLVGGSKADTLTTEAVDLVGQVKATMDSVAPEHATVQELP